VAGPLRIVIADDQASVREGLVVLLGLLPDIEVVGSAANGQEAIDLVCEHHPDAILLDLHMPVLDGIQATRVLTSEHPDVAIVVLTTYADDTSVLAALGAGARSYLTVTRLADGAGTVSFAGTPYRCGRHWAHTAIEVSIVAGSVQLSKDGKVIRVHPIRHDRSRELGAFANPHGRPRRKNSAIGNVG
jgi:CheY-like chemotaxis protein